MFEKCVKDLQIKYLDFESGKEVSRFQNYAHKHKLSFLRVCEARRALHQGRISKPPPKKNFFSLCTLTRTLLYRCFLI